MTRIHSDVLVLFGVTGDLAHKMIFPALYAMVKRGALKVPVIGVAFPQMDHGPVARAREGQYRAEQAESMTSAHLGVTVPAEYVSGDYKDPATFTAIKQALGGARRPAHYLAIPPSLFETVIEGLVPRS